MSKITKKTLKKNKALFLDRDGVINEDYGYVYQIKKFHLIKNIQVIINVAQKIGYKIIIVTNQAGIGKKIFSISDFHKLTRHMKNLLLKYNCYIDAVYYCPFHPRNGIGKYLKDSYDRKPNPGMLLKAKKKFNLDMTKSVLIGDNISDIKAGNKSFVKTNILFNKNKKKYKKININSDQFIEINCLTEVLKYL